MPSLNQNQNEKAVRAYSFLQDRFAKNRPFPLSQMLAATDYTPSTLKGYIDKKWWWFLIETEKDCYCIKPKFRHYPLRQFLKDLQQKIDEPPDVLWSTDSPRWVLLSFLVLLVLWIIGLHRLRQQSWWIVPLLAWLVLLFLSRSSWYILWR